jgi:5-methylcytosine-specific restriction endonuclease McrA
MHYRRHGRKRSGYRSRSHADAAQDLERARAQRLPVIEKLNSFFGEAKDVDRKIAKLNEHAEAIRSDPQSLNRHRWLFNDHEFTRESRDRLSWLRREKEALEQEFSRKAALLFGPNISVWETLFGSTKLIDGGRQSAVPKTCEQALADTIEHHKSILSNAEDRLRVLTKKMEKAGEIHRRKVERKARVAEILGESREAASAVKRFLPRNHPCPYCGGPLGEAPHAEHIYPVYKGGHSVPSNMVYACSRCNAAKGSLTLTAFIDKQGFDLPTVLKRLRQLGKEV